MEHNQYQLRKISLVELLTRVRAHLQNDSPFWFNQMKLFQTNPVM